MFKILNSKPKLNKKAFLFPNIGCMEVKYLKIVLL